MSQNRLLRLCSPLLQRSLQNVQPLNYNCSAMILMGVISVALVENLLRPLNCWSRSRVILAPRRSPFITRSVAFAAVLTCLASASTPHAEALDITTSAATDKALYDYESRYPLHRGYMYCLVAIEYSGDYQSRFCPGSRGAIILAQRALKQPILDMHDDGELRRILLMIAKSAKDSRAVQPEHGAKAPVPSGTLDHISRRYEKKNVEQPFLYCYADILYFAEPDSAYCRYTIAKLNLDLFEDGERILPDGDSPVLFSILKSIISKEKP